MLVKTTVQNSTLIAPYLPSFPEADRMKESRFL